MVTFSKKPGISTYIQIKDFLFQRIQNQEFKVGEKLPTEKELAQQLGVSRNTVSAAYQMLDDEKIIESTPGKGTFIRLDFAAVRSLSRKEQMARSIDDSIVEALRLGFSFEQYLSFVTVRIREFSLASLKINLVFIDCNEEQTDYFRRQFQNDPELSIQTIMLDELAAIKDSALITSADLVITTVRHLADVRVQLPSVNVVAISTAPNLRPLIDIANIVPRYKTGFICSGATFHHLFTATLEKTGIPHDRIDCCGPEDDMAAFVREHDALIVTPIFESVVRKYLTPVDQKPIVTFAFEIDAGSLHTVYQHIAEIKAKKNTIRTENHEQ